MSSAHDSSGDASLANAPKPAIGLVTLVLLVVANMIGASIFVSSAFSMADLGNANLILGLWVAAGGMALCGAIGYGALARRIPLSGGEYLYLSRLVHPLVGFLAGWISLVAGFTAPIANSAMVAAEYLLPDPWRSFFSLNAVASAVILSAAAVHGFRVHLGAWLQNGIVLSKLALILLFLGLAFVLGPADGWHDGVLENARMPKDASASTISYFFLASLVWVVLAYTGFNAAVYVAGEAPQAERLVPKAMLIATILVTAIYLALNAVFIYAIPADRLAGNESFVADVARAIGGPWMEGSMRAVIVLSQITGVSAMLMAGPRVYARMAADGYLPNWLNLKAGIPRGAIAVQALLSLVVVWVAGLQFLIGYLGLTLTLCGAMTISSGWWIHRKYPNVAPLRWFEHVAMAAFVGSAAVIFCVSASFKPHEFYTSVATFALGLAAYFIGRSQLRRD